MSFITDGSYRSLQTSPSQLWQHTPDAERERTHPVQLAALTITCESVLFVEHNCISLIEVIPRSQLLIAGIALIVYVKPN